MYLHVVIPKPLTLIEPSDLEVLISAPRLEGRQIDYKLELPGNSDDDKREFLADVTAFANADGGDLVFGVEEESGIPVAIRGVAVTNFDDLRLKLQNTIREATDPRLANIDVVSVGTFERGPVIVVRVHQSWQAPHMVSYRRWSRFFKRDAGQRHQMDAQELRTAFVAGEATAQRIRTFREGRVAAIARGDTPVKLFPHAAGVVHILPVGAAFESATLDPGVAQSHATQLLSADFVYSGNFHFNLARCGGGLQPEVRWLLHAAANTASPCILLAEPKAFVPSRFRRSRCRHASASRVCLGPRLYG